MTFLSIINIIIIGPTNKSADNYLLVIVHYQMKFRIAWVCTYKRRINPLTHTTHDLTLLARR